MEDGIKEKIQLACPLCGDAKTTEKETVGIYKIFDCENCSGSFCEPMKEGGAEFYEESYGAEGGGYGEEKEEFSNFFKKIKKTGSVLEVGCGPGYFLKTAKDFGLEVFGVDPNKYAVEHARNLGLSGVHIGGIKDIQKIFGNNKFDYAVLFSVLEHLNDPLGALMELHSCLRPGGMIFIVVPNKKRSSAKHILNGKRDGWDYPPHHLSRWEKRTLSGLLNRVGFDDIEVEEGRISSFKGAHALAHGWLWLNLSSMFGSRAGAAILKGERVALVSENSPRSILRSTVMFIASATLSIPLYLISKIFILRPTNLWATAVAKK